MGMVRMGIVRVRVSVRVRVRVSVRVRVRVRGRGRGARPRTRTSSGEFIMILLSSMYLRQSTALGLPTCLGAG